MKWTRTSETATRFVLKGSFLFTIVLVLFLLVSLLHLRHPYVLGELLVSLGALIYMSLAAYLLHRRRIRVAAWMLLALYMTIAGFILHEWGVNAPIGILLLGFAITLTSILLGAKYISYVTVAAITLLVWLHLSSEFGISHPDRSMLANHSTFGDIASYATIFSIFALTAWLSGRQMEQSLRRALVAESELQEEKDSLATKLEERTRSLHEAQAKEMEQLYRFAELGQLTTIMLHELANHLSVLTIDIDDLKSRHQNSVAIDRAKESISYIDVIIDQVRNQIKQSDNVRKFKPSIALKNTLEQLSRKHPSATIEFADTRNPHQKKQRIVGDPLRLSQAVTILVTNAVQAARHNETAKIFILVASSSGSIHITVKDFGIGISAESRLKLFEPRKSTKGNGLGIGLYITRQIIETHFKGKIWIDPSIECTQFNLAIPKLRSLTLPSRTLHIRNAHIVPSAHRQVASNEAT